jgi:hypothetical protein
METPMTRSITLHLTDAEADAFDALTAAVGQLSGRAVDAEATTAAALDLCLTRAIDDFELPDPAVRELVARARHNLRQSWTRGNACL